MLGDGRSVFIESAIDDLAYQQVEFNPQLLRKQGLISDFLTQHYKACKFDINQFLVEGSIDHEGIVLLD